MYIIRLYKPGTAFASDWVLLSRNARVLEIPAFADHIASMPSGNAALRWTDDYSNLFQILGERGL
jgi:hypothetical protein